MRGRRSARRPTSRRAPAAGAAACLLWLACMAPAVSAAEVLPEPIEKGICYDPKVHDHITGHLLFVYGVTSTGRVGGVRHLYADVEPVADEAKLIGALRQCMEGWKFKPGTRGGQPTEFGMMTPFHFFKPAPPDDPEVEIPGGKTIGQSRLDEMREEKLKLVDHLLSGRQYIEESGSGWRLKTDLGRKDANVVKEALGRAVQAFEAAFPGTPAVPDSLPVTVVAFRDGLAYNQVVAFDNLVPVKSGTEGKYSARDRIIYAAKGSKPAPVLSELFVHEMTHHLIRHRLYAAGRKPPAWVNEGVATLLECMKQEGKQGVDLQAVERTRVIGGPYIHVRPAAFFLGVVDEAVKRGTLPALGDLAGGALDPAFEGAKWDLLYGTSWLLVHYLVNAEAGKHRAAFQAWMTGPEWDGGGEALARALGRPLPEIEAQLPVYLKSLR